MVLVYGPVTASCTGSSNSHTAFANNIYGYESKEMPASSSDAIN